MKFLLFTSYISCGFFLVCMGITVPIMLRAGQAPILIKILVPFIGFLIPTLQLFYLWRAYPFYKLSALKEVDAIDSEQLNNLNEGDVMKRTHGGLIVINIIVSSLVALGLFVFITQVSFVVKGVMRIHFDKVEDIALIFFVLSVALWPYILIFNIRTFYLKRIVRAENT